MSRSVKGLLIKDFKLMKAQMKFFCVIMILWGVFMSANFSPYFFVGYIAVLCSFLTLSTINYDEYENGVVYLFTLPIRRRDYIKSKYVFGFLSTALPTVLAGTLAYVAAAIRGIDTDLTEWLLCIVMSVAAGCALLALEIPLQIRFGPEKSRFVSFISIGLMVAGINIIASVISPEGISETAVSSIAGSGYEMFVLLAVMAAAVFLCISYWIACRFEEKKQF